MKKILIPIPSYGFDPAEVRISSTKEMYEPVLEEMETFGFSFKKETIALKEFEREREGIS